MRKLDADFSDDLFVQQLLSLRLAVILCHARRDPDYRAISLQFKPRHIKLVAEAGWANLHPQSAWLIQEESIAWQKAGWRFSYSLE